MRPFRVMRMGGGGGGSTGVYDSLVLAAGPLMWWKHEETSGTVAADSSGNGYTGQGFSDYSTSPYSVAPIAGYAGLGRGHKTVQTRTVTSDIALCVGASATDAWTIVIWMTGDAAGQHYVFNRGNDAAVLYGYVAGQVEFLGNGTGADPRPGSQIPLSHADTTTPHMIVYRYNNGVWSGWKDGVVVFSVARSFGAATTTKLWYSNTSNAGGNAFNGATFDNQLYNRALSDTEIPDLYAARNS